MVRTNLRRRAMVTLMVLCIPLATRPHVQARECASTEAGDASAAEALTVGKARAAAAANRGTPSVLPAPQARVLFVDDDACGGADGLTWDSAFTTVQQALAAAQPGDEIWVAEGVYPTSAYLASGVSMYGGFAGTETARAQRDWEAHPTVLTGDRHGDDLTDARGVVTSTYNVRGSNYLQILRARRLDQPVVVDGFIVTASGYDYSLWVRGGGMQVYSSTVALANLVFSANSANYAGGLSVGENSHAALSNVEFVGNRAPECGGGMEVVYSSATLERVSFLGNIDGSNAGGLWVGEADVSVSNGLFVGNEGGGGGGLYVEHWGGGTSEVTLHNTTFVSNTTRWSRHGAIGYHGAGVDVEVVNSILWDNGPESVDVEPANPPQLRYSSIEGGCPAGASCSNLRSGTPGFVRYPSVGFGARGFDDDYGDLRLRRGSVGIDRATSAGAPSSDLLDQPRPLGAGYDLGAYEFVQGALRLASSSKAEAGYGVVVPFAHALTNQGWLADDVALRATGDWLQGVSPSTVQLGVGQSTVVTLYGRVAGQPLSGTAGTITLTAYSGNEPTVTAVTSNTLVLALQADADSDGDGRSDLEEGDGDEDGDGVPDYLDRLVRIHIPLVLRGWPPIHELSDDAPDACPGYGPLALSPHRYREDIDALVGYTEDEDWFAFSATAGVSYTIRATTLGPRADTVLWLYDRGCGRELAHNDDVDEAGGNFGSAVAWEAPAGGTYHVRVKHYYWNVWGPGTEYELSVREN